MKQVLLVENDTYISNFIYKGVGAIGHTIEHSNKAAYQIYGEKIQLLKKQGSLNLK